MTHSYRPFRLEISGQLHLESFHIGSGHQLSLVSDSPILRDPQGAAYVPASSLRGVIRAHLEREASLLSGNIQSLFGEVPGRREEDENSHFGRLTIFDATSAEKIASEVRDHVAIDGKLGSAKSGAKFDQELAFATSPLAFGLIYEGDSACDPDLLLVKEAVRALEHSELACGAKSGLGFGRITLSQTRYRTFQRSQPAGLAAWLAYRLNPELTASDAAFTWPQPDGPQGRANPAAPPLCRLNLTLRLQFDGPVLVRAPLPPLPSGKVYDPRSPADLIAKGAETADHVFVRNAANAHYLPGSSLRGVLRHQALRIAHQRNQQNALDQLFGTLKKETGRKGRLEVSDGTLLEPPLEPPRPIYLDHVAIDRITGFAADGLKFATCGLESPAFRTELTLRFSRADLAAVALFGFLLRDAIDGWLWAGGGVTRGYGHLAHLHITAAHLDLTDDFSPPSDFLPGSDRQSDSGRTRINAGPIAFEDLHWLWTLAEAAWNQQESAA